MIIKMPSKQYMPNYYCNSKRQYVHFNKHIVKHHPRTHVNVVNKYFNGCVNSDVSEVQKLDYILCNIIYEVGHLSPTDKDEVIECYLSGKKINWKMLRD